MLPNKRLIGVEPSAEEEMPFFSCTVNEIGPAADGTETADPVIYMNLTDTGGSRFANQWF
jgi:hypothetical protein